MRGFCSLLVAGLAAPVAAADLVDSVHVGVLAHNIQVTDGKNANKEDGPNIEGQLNFTAPGALALIGGPRPYIMGSVNVAGETSFAGVGLEWRWRFAPGWSVEPGFGYVIHNGEINLPFPAGDPRNTAFNDANVLYGSRDLFRSTLGVSRAVGARTALQVFYTHLSHGQVLGNGRNQGVDQLGLRLGWRLGAE